MELYKFVSPDRIDILKHERIRYTPPLELNDPFEMRVSFKGLMPQEEIDVIINKSFDYSYVKEFLLRYGYSESDELKFLAEILIDNNRDGILKNFNTCNRALSRVC